MNRKSQSTRKFTREFLLLFVVLSAAIIFPVGYLSSHAQKDISAQFIDNAAESAAEKFRALTESMATTLELVRNWGTTELFSIEQTETLNRLLFPIFAREKLLHGISVADTDGNSYFVHPQEQGLRTRQIDAGLKSKQATITLWDTEHNKNDVITEDSDYDPRQRPWFNPTRSGEGIFWTKPYKFYTSGKVGITASTSYLRKKDQTPVVVAFDILLDELFMEIQKLAPSTNSRIFVFREDNKLYIPKTAEADPDFIPFSEITDSLIQQVYASWPDIRDLDKKAVTIQHEGTTWWSNATPINNDRSAWICVMVPEQDITGLAEKRKLMLWSTGLGSLLIAAGLAAWISRRHGKNSLKTDKDLFDSNDSQASVYRIVEHGEGPEIEFKSTIRMNLHTKKPGKEIELAWLKGVAAFLNTDGGILLLGVTDSGEITGLEQDVFENEDKCKLHFKNLVAQHIGAELSKYIEFQIVPIGDKTVGVILCERSTEPIFLQTNKSEAFYIRNGPSSDELPVSKALNYINSRF